MCLNVKEYKVQLPSACATNSDLIQVFYNKNDLKLTCLKEKKVLMYLKEKYIQLVYPLSRSLNFEGQTGG